MSLGKRERTPNSALRCLGFTNTLALLLVLLLAAGLAGGFVLAVLSIRYQYTGALACYTAAFAPMGTAISIVLARVVDKSKAENTGANGEGVVYAAAQAAGFVQESENSPAI